MQKKLIKGDYINKLYVIIFTYHNLEFNKYVCDVLYQDVKKLNKIEKNKFSFLNIFNFANNKFDNYFISEIEKQYKNCTIPKDSEVFDYYIKNLNLTNVLGKYSINQKINLYRNIYSCYSINSFDKMIKYKKILQIEDYDFVSKILFKLNDDKYSWDNNQLIYKVCKLGNIEYFINIINNFNIDKKYYKNDVVCKMFSHAVCSKNKDFVIILYEYLKSNIKINFNKEFLSEILLVIVQNLGSSHNEYNDIIYEFIHLGAVIKGYGDYTDYIKSLKFL